MSFFKPWTSFPLNFESPISVMTLNSSEIFYQKHYIHWIKKALQYTIFQTFECSNESSHNSSCHFCNHKVRVYSNFTSLFSVMKDHFSAFFLAQTLYTLDKKSPSKWNFQTFEWLGGISPNSSRHTWNHKSVFL